MPVAERSKYNAIYFLLLSVVIRWGFNILYVAYKGFSPMEYAILHMIFSVISLALAFMTIQLFRKSRPSGSNLGCVFVVIMLVNFVMAVGSVFGALIHLFAAKGGQIETIWLM